MSLISNTNIEKDIKLCKYNYINITTTKQIKWVNINKQV